MKSGLTDEEVELEIKRLRESEFVRLALKDEAVRYARRNYLYRLRGLEKRGRELSEAGVTLESLAEEMNCEAH